MKSLMGNVRDRDREGYHFLGAGGRLRTTGYKMHLPSFRECFSDSPSFSEKDGGKTGIG